MKTKTKLNKQNISQNYSQPLTKIFEPSNKLIVYIEEISMDRICDEDIDEEDEFYDNYYLAQVLYDNQSYKVCIEQEIYDRFESNNRNLNGKFIEIDKRNYLVDKNAINKLSDKQVKTFAPYSLLPGGSIINLKAKVVSLLDSHVSYMPYKVELVDEYEERMWFVYWDSVKLFIDKVDLKKDHIYVFLNVRKILYNNEKQVQWINVGSTNIIHINEYNERNNCSNRNEIIRDIPITEQMSMNDLMYVKQNINHFIPTLFEKSSKIIVKSECYIKPLEVERKAFDTYLGCYAHRKKNCVQCGEDLRIYYRKELILLEAPQKKSGLAAMIWVLFGELINVSPEEYQEMSEEELKPIVDEWNEINKFKLFHVSIEIVKNGSKINWNVVDIFSED